MSTTCSVLVLLGATTMLSIALALTQNLRFPAPPTEHGDIDGVHWFIDKIDDSTRNIHFNLPLANSTASFARMFEVFVPHPPSSSATLRRIIIDSPGYMTTLQQEQRFSPMKRRGMDLEAIVVTTVGPTDVFNPINREQYGGWNAWGWSDNESPTPVSDKCTPRSMCNEGHGLYPCYISQIASVTSTGKCTPSSNSGTCSTMSKQDDIQYMRIVVAILDILHPGLKIITHGQSMGGIISEATFQEIGRIDGAIGVSSGAAFNRGVPMHPNEHRPLLHYHGVLDATIPTCLNSSFIVNELLPNAGLKIAQTSTPLESGDVLRLGEGSGTEWKYKPWMSYVYMPVRPNCTDALGNAGCLSSDWFIYGSLQTLYDNYRTGRSNVRLEDASWEAQPLTGLDLSESTFGAHVACTDATSAIRLCLVDTNHLLPYMRPFSGMPWSTDTFVQGSRGEDLYIERVLSWLAEHNL